MFLVPRVRVYIVDTGVSPNPTLGVRLVAGFAGVADGYGTTDCHGHGTHVAGTVASTVYGVAKGATVVPVRVLDCAGSGSTTTVVAGLDWIVAHHPAGTPGVVNLSLGGTFDTALNAAIAAVVADGLTVVVAAGNSNVDACTTSPAAAPAALTVGASDSTDTRASFSNWGACLDLFAPGVAIQSLSASNPSGSAVMSGTSMAAPHAAGVAALYLAQLPAATPAQVATALVSGGEHAVTNAGTGSTTDLLSSNVIPAPDAVGGLAVTARTATALTLTWTAPAGTAALTYQATYRTGGGTWTTAPAVAGTTTTLTGLAPGTTYEVRVTATDEFGTGTPTGPVTTSTTGATAPPPPPPPTLTPTQRYVTSVYAKLFTRAPDPGGLAGWTSALDGGVPRRAVADAITSSAEYRGILISAAYQAYLGRGPDAGGQASWLANMNAGMTIQQMEAGFVASPEYYQKAGGTPDGWVTKLYVDVLGRTPAPAEVTFWTDQVARGSSHGTVALGFLLSTEHLSTVLDGHYQHLLGRGIDPSGQATWVGAIQHGSRIEEVIGGIIASPEYYAKNT